MQFTKRSSGNAGPEGDTEGGDLNAREGRLLDILVSAVQASALPVWILGGAVTASGRILADVHWYVSCLLQNAF